MSFTKEQLEDQFEYGEEVDGNEEENERPDSD